jgi:hypothetical protein
MPFGRGVTGWRWSAQKSSSQEDVSEDGKSVTRQVATAFATSRGWSIAHVSVS